MLDVLTDHNWSPRLPIQCWLIEHSEGLILVDTGESSRANDPGYQPWWHPFMQTCERRWVDPEEEAGARLKRMGFSPSDVRTVIMTHMHGDHAGAIASFPEASFILSPGEAKACLSRSGPLQGYLNMHYPSWFKPKAAAFSDGPWESFTQSVTPTRDGAIRIVPTPGHTMGHISVAVEMDDAVVFIGGDASYNEQALKQQIVDGVAHSAAAHRESTKRILDLCRRRAVITQFAHDPESESRLIARQVLDSPKGQVNPNQRT